MNIREFLVQLISRQNQTETERYFLENLLLTVNTQACLSKSQQEYVRENIQHMASRGPEGVFQVATYINSCRKPEM